MKKMDYNFYVVESGRSIDGYNDRVNGVVYYTWNMLRVAFMKFLDDDSVKSVEDVCDEDCNYNTLSAGEVADYIVKVFKDMGDTPRENFELRDSPWGKDYLVRVLTPDQVPDYVPFTSYKMVAVVGDGTDRRGNTAGIKTKRIVLSKKESEIEYADDESGIELQFDQLIPRDSDI